MADRNRYKAGGKWGRFCAEKGGGLLKSFPAKALCPNLSTNPDSPKATQEDGLHRGNALEGEKNSAQSQQKPHIAWGLRQSLLLCPCP